MSTPLRGLVVLAFASLLAAGCGKGFHATTPQGFVEVAEDEPVYDYRAVAPDGVALAVRSVDIDDATDLAFWERAVSLRMRELEGYALVEAHDVRSADGTPGRELVFGHDEEGKPFVYRVRLFVSANRLFVVEAGGSDENMRRWSKSVEHALQSFRAG